MPILWLHKKLTISEVIGGFVQTKIGSDTMATRHKSGFKQELSTLWQFKEKEEEAQRN